MQTQMDAHGINNTRVEAVEGDGVPDQICTHPEGGTLVCPRQVGKDMNSRGLVLPPKTKLVSKSEVQANAPMLLYTYAS